MEWEYLENAMYFQVEWDSGWGTGEFDPLKNAYSREETGRQMDNY
jgi:hypothetical protein